MSERRRLLLPNQGRITEDVVQVYTLAVRSDVPMSSLVEVVEALRDEARAASDAYVLSEAYDSAVLKVVGEPAQPMLQQLRSAYRSAMAARAGELLAAAGDDAPTEWLRLFAEALTEDDLMLCSALIEFGHRAGVPADHVEALDLAIRAARDDWWFDIGEHIVRLLEQDIWTPLERAQLMAVESLVQLRTLEERSAALETAEEALKADPDSSLAIHARGVALVGRGRHDEAEAFLAPHLEAHPEVASTHVAFAECASARGDAATAELRIKDGLSKAHNPAELIAPLFDLYCSADLFRERRSQIPLLMAQRVATTPDYGYGADMQLANACINAERLDEAATILENAIRTRPDRPDAFLNLATCRIADDTDPENLAKARSLLLQALDVRPHHAVVAGWLSYTYALERDFESAVEWSLREVEWTRGNKDLAYAGLALREAEIPVADEDGEAGWESCVRAVEAGPDDNRLLGTLDELFIRRWRAGKADDVRALFDVMLASRGDAFRAEYHNRLGEIAVRANDTQAGLVEYDHAIAAAPVESQYQRNRLDALRELERWDDAFATVDAIFEIDHDEAARGTERALTHNDRGNAAYAEGRYDDAIADYQAAIDLSPQDPVLHGNLAAGLESGAQDGSRTTSLARAAEALRTAHALDPDGGYAARLAQVEARLARVKRFGDLIEHPASVDGVTIEFAANLVPLVDPDQLGGEVMNEIIPAMRAWLADLMGFDLPGVQMTGAALPPDQYRISVFGCLRAVGTAMPDHDCMMAAAQQLIDLGLDPEVLVEEVSPVTDALRTWAPRDALDAVDLGDLPRYTPTDIVFEHVADELRKSAAAFFTLDVATEWMKVNALPVETESQPADATGPAEQNRILVAARALRGLVQSGLRIDGNVLAEVLAHASQVQDDNPLSHAAAVVESVRASILQLVDDVPAASVPGWAEEILASGRRLSVLEEQRLLGEFEPLVRPDGTLIVATASGRRAYLGRLLSGRYGSEGTHVNVSAVADSATVPVLATPEAARA